MAKSKNIDEKDALSYLDNIDAENKVNTSAEVTVEKSENISTVKSIPKNSLGKIKGIEDPGLSAAGDSPWKLLSFDLLPSKGLFYPKGTELLIKSAKTKEIRHWSTMDEHDPIDVREKMAFILNKCTKFKIKGKPIHFNLNDFLEVDKFHILFRIQELTFPNNENKLMANIKCTNPKCGVVNRVQVGSQNLLGFEIPKGLEKWYSEEERQFVIPSEKLNETLRFSMPTIGVTNAIRDFRQGEVKKGIDLDESFYNFSPYLISDFRNLSKDQIHTLKLQSNGWSQNKFLAIHKFTEDLKKSSVNKVTCVCESCKTQITTSIFLGGSFTVKDIFVISARFDELI